MKVRVQMTEVYRDWINALKDLAVRARIQMRVDRLVHGNPGQHRSLVGGICELKIDWALDTVFITRNVGRN